MFGSNPNFLVMEVIFSVLGMLYFGWGKKDNNDYFFYSGLFLMIFPMFISNLYVGYLLGGIVSIIPFIKK